MDKYRPIHLKILPSVEMWLKSKGWGRGITLAWFWCIGTIMMSREMSGWMSVSDDLVHVSSYFTNISSLQVNWLRPRQGWIGGRRSHTGPE